MKKLIYTKPQTVITELEGGVVLDSIVASSKGETEGAYGRQNDNFFADVSE